VRSSWCAPRLRWFCPQGSRIRRRCGSLGRSGEGDPKAVEVFDPKSGRVLEVATTEPGVQLYVATYKSGKVGKSGHVYNRYGVFCLETQHYSDSPNKPEFPFALLRPGETYKSRTVYAFSVR